METRVWGSIAKKNNKSATAIAERNKFVFVRIPFVLFKTIKIITFPKHPKANWAGKMYRRFNSWTDLEGLKVGIKCIEHSEEQFDAIIGFFPTLLSKLLSFHDETLLSRNGWGIPFASSTIPARALCDSCSCCCIFGLFCWSQIKKWKKYVEEFEYKNLRWNSGQKGKLREANWGKERQRDV